MSNENIIREALDNLNKMFEAAKSDSSLLQFDSTDKSYIPGRGSVYSVIVPQNMVTSYPINRHVMIDNERYLCKGVEQFAKHRDRPEILMKGDLVGLLVEKI